MSAVARKARRSLPEFWMRIARPESERHPDRKRFDDFALKPFGQMDEVGQWPSFDTGVEAIEAFFDFPIRDHIRTCLQTMPAGRRYKVIDLGCGTGQMLSDLKGEFKDRIKTVGTNLSMPGQGLKPGVDRHLKSPLLDLNTHETYDLAVCYMGSTNYMHQRTAAVEKVLGLIKPGGIGVLDVRVPDEDPAAREREYMTLFAQHGIKKGTYFIDDKRVVFQKPKVKLP